MRRRWSCLLVVLLLAGVAAADSPVEGTWKVMIVQPQKLAETTLWLVKVEGDGKKLAVVAGIDRSYMEAPLKGVKIDDKGMRFTLTPDKNPPFEFAMLPPPRDDKETMRGNVMIGGAVIPAWLEKTEQTEIEPRTAVQKVGALGDLQAAMKKADPDEKQKELIDVAKTHRGRPVGLLAHQQLLGELMRAKAKAPALRSAAEAYIETSQLFGPRMVFTNRLQISNALRGTPPLLEVALEHAEAAVKMLNDDLPAAQHLTAYLALTSTLAMAGKKEEADRLVPKVKEKVEEILKGEKADRRLTTMMSVAGPLVGSPATAVADLGLEYIRKGHAMVEKDAPPARKLMFEKYLRDALVTRGKKDEAEKLTAAIDKAEVDLDAAFEKANVPFEVKKFAGRKGKSERAVLVEQFTGAQDARCVAADVAFAAGRKAYGPKDVVFLQYHLHVPLPDALTTADGEARQRYYGKDAVPDTPAVLIDGQPGPALGGGRAQAEDRYGELVKGLATALEEAAGAKLTLKAKRDGEKIEIKADVSGLSSPGAKVRLRFVLVEEVARFHGNNGQRLHYHVVRSFPGGVSGFKLEKKDVSQAVTADLESVKKSQLAYMAAFRAKTSVQFREVPLALKKLKVIAFVQDDDSKKVLQAALVEVE